MSESRFQLWSFVVVLLLFASAPCFAQVQTGTPPFGSYGGGPDIINLANLNAHLTIPIVQKAGRGTNFSYNLNLDSSVWYPVGSSGSQTWQPNGLPVTGQFGSSAGHTYFQIVRVQCPNPNYPPTLPKTLPSEYFTNYVYVDIYGVGHPFNITWENDGCQTTGAVQALATDGSGYTMSVDINANVTVTPKSGGLFVPATPSGTGAGSMTDKNGNQITQNSSGVITDTLGTTALTIAGSSPTTFTYTAPSGGSAVYKANYTSETVKTNFGCSGIAEFGPTAESLLSSITLPDGSAYTFTYEETTPGISSPVTGRLASVTLPTGGTISYAYSGGSNGITCADGSTATLTRTTPDGIWIYAHSESGTAWTTTITDPSPQKNQTLLNFQGIYETERQVYNGSTTLLKTTYTCYNGNATPSTCNSTAVALPITERTVFQEWPAGGLQSRTNTLYNVYGLVTEKDEYAYGPGAPGGIARKTLTTYASLTNGIVNKPASVTIEDGSGNVKAKTTYCYDEGTPSGTSTCAAAGSPTVTSGTPQHVAVTGSRGNLTTMAAVVQGSTILGQTYTYYDTGNVLTAKDVNGAQATFLYGTGSCGNSFPTSVNESLSLTRSMVWNCTGSVQTSVTDENGKTTSATYMTDSDFWRPNATKDQESNVTSMTYRLSGTGITSAESSLPFNGSISTSDTLVTLDISGRVSVSQSKESQTSSTYDSVETDYDSLGRPWRKTLPYATTVAGQTNPTAPGTTTTYDALSRKLTVEDSEASPRTVTFAYNQNDTYRTLGPAPASENPKRKQFEYDALGRLTSVCEVTLAAGSGACNQTSTATGFWTKYAYDLNNNLTAVTQNAQSSGSQQTRMYAYDDLGRMTSETNPESGTTNYTYDTDATCGTYNGNLVKKTDAVGNTTCFTYDLLHRTLSVTYSGPYSSNTPNKYFVYDAATVNGVAMANVKSRLAEAYTATSPTSTKITDVGLSYSARGEASDVYESTPNSGGLYYHSSATYWANGALETLGSNIATLPTFTYATDGEGRINTVSASVGPQNPVTGTTYNVASLPTQVNLGSSDVDSFLYDPASNRMTQYKFTVNSQSVVGTLTWNSIGTLKDLAITDPFYGAGNQSCAYTHDDMSRIASANCGSPWSQTFSYDVFGNISKSGTVSFQPTYSYVTNRMTQVGSSTPAYDANGNATNDTAHTYAWDAAGRPVTTDTVGLTYDALGRMVEQNKSGTYYQIVYTPAGTKFAIMNGSALQKAFVPLSGGSQAVYTSSGLAYYRHSDWIGSSRFASTPTRTLYFDGAYAPFGEAYAQTGTSDLSFSGMNQDTAANLYDFPAREYNSIHGRWPSPDPAGVSAVRPRNPQTWNRYAYVHNSPLSHVDPLGMDPDPEDPEDPGPGVDPLQNDGECDDDSCGGSGGGDCTDDDSCSDDGQNPDGCDDQCQLQINQAEELALAALNNPMCAKAVDGGSGAAAATIQGIPGLSVGTITTADLGPGSGGGGILVHTDPVPGSVSIYGGSMSLIQININPTAGFFNLFVSNFVGTNGGDQGLSQVTSLLHDLGHAALIAGLSSAVFPDIVPGPINSMDLSAQNSSNIADACFPEGDGDQGQGDQGGQGSTAVDAAKKRVNHRF